MEMAGIIILVVWIVGIGGLFLFFTIEINNVNEENRCLEPFAERICGNHGYEFNYVVGNRFICTDVYTREVKSLSFLKSELEFCGR